MPEIIYCQFIIIEFVYSSEKDRFETYFTFSIDEDNCLVLIGRDHDKDVEKLIERTANFAYRNLSKILEFSVLHDKDDSLREVNLKDYLTVETRTIIGEEDSDFSVYEYITENKLILVEGNEQIH